MAEELVMPRLSDTMERGTIARWLVQEGDRIANGDVLAEIETDKAVMELQAYDDGVLLRILVGEGETADLGAPIALVGEEGEDVPTNGAGGDATAADAEPEAPAEESGGDAAPAQKPAAAQAAPAGQRQAEPAAASDGQLRASPVARRLADEAGIDLRVLAGKGSGPEGRIVRVDVERLLGKVAPPAAAAPAVQVSQDAARPRPAAPVDAEVVEPSTMLKVIARRMTAVKAPVPHFYLETEVEMTRLLALRKELNAALADEGVRVSVTDLIVRASAVALMANPQSHRSWVDGKLHLHRQANVGIAVALDDGLIVPVVHGADRLGPKDIARASGELVERARAGRLRQDEIEGGTFTVSNLGMFGVTRFAAIINAPEPAILAVGATTERPVVRDGEIVARPIMSAVLSVDHRATSGADGARLLDSIRKNLEEPLRLLM
jgi:pyruvate dehydrogenase E2 component (dihydrolipoamide acetyltransferase)